MSLKSLAKVINEAEGTDDRAVADALLNKVYKIKYHAPKFSMYPNAKGGEWVLDDSGEGRVWLEAPGLPDIDWMDYDNSFDLVNDYEDELEDVLEEYKDDIESELRENDEYDGDGYLTWEGSKERFFEDWKEQLTDKLNKLKKFEFREGKYGIDLGANGFRGISPIKYVYLKHDADNYEEKTYQEWKEDFKDGTYNVTFYVSVYNRDESECELGEVYNKELLDKAIDYIILNDLDTEVEVNPDEPSEEEPDTDISNDSGVYRDWWDK